MRLEVRFHSTEVIFMYLQVCVLSIVAQAHQGNYVCVYAICVWFSVCLCMELY